MKKDFFTRIIEIQKTGSRDLRDNLLRDLQNDAYRVAKWHCRKFGRTPTEEELAEALIAANEAIDHYDRKKSESFELFFQQVIVRRLRDFYRKEKREYFSALYPNISVFDQKLEEKSISEFHAKQHSEDLLDELRTFKEILAILRYTWDDVQENRPKHRDSLAHLHGLAWHIVNLRLGKRFLLEQPMSRELSKLIGANRRILKKYRPYLCALVIVYTNEGFPLIRSRLERGLDN